MKNSLVGNTETITEFFNRLEKSTSVNIHISTPGCSIHCTKGTDVILDMDTLIFDNIEIECGEKAYTTVDEDGLYVQVGDTDIYVDFVE